MCHIFVPLFHQLRVGPTCKLLQGILSKTCEAKWSRTGMEQKSLVIYALCSNFSSKKSMQQLLSYVKFIHKDRFKQNIGNMLSIHDVPN
jgi:hypothetical protein